MNKRIKELAIQAGGGPSKWYTDSDVLEYFAELIVRECMNLCSEVKKDLEVVPDKLEREATEMGVTFCYEAIKGEFGVKE